MELWSSDHIGDIAASRSSARNTSVDHSTGLRKSYLLDM